MHRAWRRTALGGRWLVALAALALAMQVLIPQGFMVGAERGAPAGLVICTGHGALVVFDHEHPAKPPKQTSGSSCPFAVHGAAGAPPQQIALSTAPFAPVARSSPSAFDLAPGRGLAAPPPPAQAPPAVLI